MCCEAQRQSWGSLSKSAGDKYSAGIESVCDKYVSFLASLQRLLGTGAVGAGVKTETGLSLTIAKRSATLENRKTYLV